MNDADESTDERAQHWWRAVENAIAKRQEPGADDLPLPDPWADAVPDVPTLTDEQQALLVGLADQPRVARLDHLETDDLDAPSDDAPPPEGADDGAPGQSPLAAVLDRAIDEVGGTTTSWREGDARG